MNKTLYIRDEDLPVWDRARELAGDKLSPVIVEALKRFVVEKEAQSRGFERIVVEYSDSLDHGLPKAKAFFGRWIIDRKKPLESYDNSSAEEVFSIAETAKTGVVVFKYRVDIGEGIQYGHKLLVYPSFSEAAADSEVNYAIREAMKRRGVPVEELDI